MEDVCGQTTWIHTDGHLGPAHLEPTAGVSRRLCSRARTRPTGVYTPLDRNNMPGRVTRLPQWSEEWDAGRARVGPGRRRRLKQAEPGRAGTKMWRYRKVPFYGHAL